jgi:predicted ATPase
MAVVHWLAVVTEPIWRDFREQGGILFGFNKGVRLRHRKPKPGDVLLCFRPGMKKRQGRWLGALEVLAVSKSGERFFRTARLPSLYTVKPLAVLDPEAGLPETRPPGELAAIPEGLTLRQSPYEFTNPEDARQLVVRLQEATRAGGRESGRPLPVPDLPPTLVRACRAGKCAVYVASGLSAAAGMPTWHECVASLLEWRLNQGDIDLVFADSLRAALREHQASVVADNLVNNRLGEADESLTRFLREQFDNPAAPLPETFGLLREVPFTAALTTNFDTLLERAYNLGPERVHTPLDVEPLKKTQTGSAEAAGAGDSFYLLKLFGTLDRPETLMVAPAQLAGAVRSSGSPRRAVRSRVKSLRLENIGPFQNQEFSFAPQWNVLIGDNGVGKSCVLKALALAICGKEAAPYADRLLRVGTTRGTITLETDQDRHYVTTLLRQETGAEVISHPARPLDVERWLAVGFPSLREVTWQRVQGFTPEGKPRYTAEDLLPLVKGEPDARADEFKRWIVSLDNVLDPSRPARAGERARARAAREALKGLFDERFGESKMHLGKVDLRAKQVCMSVPEGDLPIEAVSQGTAAVMGWLGVLLQRLFEVYGESADPQQQFALVLVDEIDAHMHPSWQREVIDKAQRLFPEAQFIATTHSPLIVGDLKPDQVYYLRRDGDNGAVVVRRMEEPMQLFRSDQILTSPPFNLPTSMSKSGQALLDEYRALLAKSNRSVDEERRFQELESKLRQELPPPPERPEDRKAIEVIEQALLDKLAKVPEADREVLFESARRVLGTETEGRQ